MITGIRDLIKYQQNLIVNDILKLIYIFFSLTGEKLFT